MSTNAQQGTSSLELPHTQPNRVFTKITMEIGTFGLQQFQLTPPPDHVTSLTLKRAELLSPHRFRQSVAPLWNFFASFWSPRLESLEVDVLQLPPNARLLQLLSSPSLRKLTCTSVQLYDTPIAAGDQLTDPFEFPCCLLRLEEISIFKFHFHARYKIFFFAQLATSRNLKRLVVLVDDDASLDGVGILIDAKRDDADFQLSIVHDASLSDQLDDLYVALVFSVAASSSKIRIVELNEKKVSNLEERVGRTVSKKFFECVQVISKMDDGVERLTNYPNLKALRQLNFGGGNLGAVEIPPTLERLRITGDIRLLPNLPGTLTHLSLLGYICTVKELLESLTALSGMCPFLQSLAIQWTSTSSRNRNVVPRSSRRLNSFCETKFPQLRSLQFHASYSYEDPLYSDQVVLVDGFQLRRLTLHELDLRGEIRLRDAIHPRPLKLDSNILGDILGGPSAKTLTSAKIDFVEDDAEPLLLKLTSVTAANKAIHTPF